MQLTAIALAKQGRPAQEKKHGDAFRDTWGQAGHPKRIYPGEAVLKALRDCQCRRGAWPRLEAVARRLRRQLFRSGALLGGTGCGAKVSPPSSTVLPWTEVVRCWPEGAPLRRLPRAG